MSQPSGKMSCDDSIIVGQLLVTQGSLLPLHPPSAEEQAFHVGTIWFVNYRSQNEGNLDLKR